MRSAAGDRKCGCAGSLAGPRQGSQAALKTSAMNSLATYAAVLVVRADYAPETAAIATPRRPSDGEVCLDLVGDAPRRLVGDGELALHLARAHPLVPRRIEEHHVEPVLQRRARARERRPGLRVDVIGAPLADIGL